MRDLRHFLLVAFTIIFCNLLSSHFVYAQLPSNIPYRKGDLWGYSTADKKITIAPRFRSAHLFNSGSAIVQGNDGKFMLINTKGEVISKPYDRISPPNEGFFPVVSNGWMGFINQSGKEIVSLQYDDEPETIFKNGLAKVAKTYHDGKKWGFVNALGEEVIPIRYYWLGDFHNGMAIYEDLQKGYGFIDATGKQVIPADANNKITQVIHFGESDRTLIKRNGVVVLIDKAGQVIKTYKYDEIGWRYEKVIMVGQNGKWGFIDYNGNIVAPLMYDEDQWGDLPFQKGLGLGVVSVNGQWGVINQQNQPIVPFQYEGLEVFPNNLMSVWRSNSIDEYDYGVLSKEGEVLPIKYRQVLICDNGYIFAADAYQWQLYNQKGELVSSKEFYAADKFSEGLAPVTQSLNGKYGYINTKAELIIPSKYTLAQPFKNGLAYVIYQGKEGYISKDGKEYWE